MKILHVVDAYYPVIGGIETFVDALSEDQKKAGHDVVILTGALPGAGPYEEINGIPVFRQSVSIKDIANRPDQFLKLTNELREHKNLINPDIIHCHGSRLAAWCNCLTKTSAPTVLTLHGTLQLPEIVQDRILMQADVVTSVSASLARQFDKLPCSKKKSIQVLYNGVRFPKFNPHPTRGKNLTLLCVGRVVEEKGFDIVIRALVKIGGVNLQIAGDGSARKDLEKLVKQLGLSSKVEFLGFIEPTKIFSLMSQAHIVVIPSRCEESFGLVAVEAALMGRPVIASNRGGLAEIIIEGETGMLVQPEDPDAITAAVQILLNDPERAEKMGANARERALALFSMRRCASEFFEIYLSLLNERGL